MTDVPATARFRDLGAAMSGVDWEVARSEGSVRSNEPVPRQPPGWPDGMTRVRAAGFLSFRRHLALTLGLALVIASGCSLNGGTLGGREKCWPESDPRAPSLWRGILQIDASGTRLATPEGDDIPLLPGALQIGARSDGVGALVRGSEVVATVGDDVTLFGGAGSDGALVVCGVEEVHADS